jgi:hypothetical protein
MARASRSYQDNRGAFYTTPEEAAAADIAALLGRIGGETGMAEGIARKLLAMRAEISACFAEYEAMLADDEAAPVAKLRRRG